MATEEFRTISEFEGRLNQLDAKSFEAFVYDILLSTGQIENIETNVNLKGYQFDIIASEKKNSAAQEAKKWIIETKRARIIGADAIQSILLKLNAVKQSFPKARYLLISTGQPTSIACDIGLTGFWKSLKETYQAHYIVVDAKNYSEPLDKGPVIDITHYLKPYGCGMFGMLISRFGTSKAGDHAIREQWIGNGKMIVVISDEDVIEMLRIKKKDGPPEEIIRKKIAQFRLLL